MGRICVLCYNHTYRNLPFCYSCYLDHKEVIDEAIAVKSEWLKYLERETQKEHRILNKQKMDYSLDLLDEEFFLGRRKI